MPTELSWNLIAIVALGMAISVSIVDFRSARTGTLALGFAMLGLALVLDANFMIGKKVDEIPPWANWATLAGTFTMLALTFWLKLIRPTAQTGAADRVGEIALTCSLLATLAYGALAFSFPEWRVHYLFRLHDAPNEVLRSRQFYLLFLPIFLACCFLLLAMIRTLQLQLDPPERLRLIGFCIAVPLILLSFPAPREVAPYFAVIGEMVLLIAVMQFHMHWGQRGQFMSRFLSPQVAAAVRSRGLDEAMHEDRLELTVVACDIRGFSTFAEQNDSSQVISLLKAYYGTVGDVAAAHGATIKDYAGDGILLLVGAPLPNPNHAHVALALAADLRTHCDPLWQDRDLGLGVGIATGQVSVGLVGTKPMEYAAVGRAVNLASRLCDHAKDGEILLSERTLELVDVDANSVKMHPEGKVQFKGLAEPVHIWSISADADTQLRIRKKKLGKRKAAPQFLQWFGMGRAGK